MNTRKQRHLSDDLLAGALTREPMPASVDRLLDSVMGEIGTRRQLRPRSGILGRFAGASGGWSPVLLPRIAVGVLLLVALLLVLGVAIGSRARTPAPFGPARTGLLAFTDHDEIVLLGGGVSPWALPDPSHIDWEPTFSRDGTHLAYWSRSAADQAIASRNVPGGYVVTGHAELRVRDMATGAVSTAASAIVVGPPPHGAPFRWFGSASTLSWSTDGSSIAFASRVDNHDAVSVVDLGSGDVLRTSPAGMDASDPQWSPGGTTIGFRGSTPDGAGAYVMDADGANVRELAPAIDGYGPESFVLQWSPDGTLVSFSAGEAIWIVDVATGAYRRLAEDPDQEFVWPAWSPDGTRLAWLGSSGPSVVIAVADGTGVPTVIRSAPSDAASGSDLSFDFGASTPMWSPDGTQIGGLIGGRPNAVDDALLIVDVGSDGPGTTLSRTMVGAGSWQRLGP